MEFIVDASLMWELLSLGIAGFAAGIIAGLFGVGGGLIVVPVIYHVLLHKQIPPELAIAVSVATSLVSILPTSLSSVYAHHKLKNVEWAIVKSWAAPLMIGVVLGGFCVSYLRSTVFVIFFASLMITLAILKLFFLDNVTVQRGLPSRGLASVYAFLIGFFSTLAGIGGGSLTVPTLRIHSVPIKKAIGSAAGFGVLISVAATVTVLAAGGIAPNSQIAVIGLIYWPALIVLLPITVVMAPCGAKLANRLSNRMLSNLFAGLLLVLGARMFASVL